MPIVAVRPTENTTMSRAADIAVDPPTFDTDTATATAITKQALTEEIAIDIIGDAVSWPFANILIRALARLSISTSTLQVIAVILHIDAPNRKVTISLLDHGPIPPALVTHLQAVWDQLKFISAEFSSFDKLMQYRAASLDTPVPSSPRDTFTAAYKYSATNMLSRFDAWLPLVTEFTTVATTKYTGLVALTGLIEAFAATPTTPQEIRDGTNPRWLALQTFLRGIPAAEWLLRECTVWAADVDEDNPERADIGMIVGILPRLRAFARVLQSRAYTLGEFAGVLAALTEMRGVVQSLAAGGGQDLSKTINTFDWVAGVWEELRAETMLVAEDFVVADWAASPDAVVSSPLLADMRLPQKPPPPPEGTESTPPAATESTPPADTTSDPSTSSPPADTTTTIPIPLPAVTPALGPSTSPPPPRYPTRTDTHTHKQHNQHSSRSTPRWATSSRTTRTSSTC